jgi:hypothetical protein
MEAISNDFHENCESYLLKTLVKRHLNYGLRELPIDEKETIEVHGKEYECRLGCVWVETIEIRGSFAKVVIKGGADVWDKNGGLLNILSVTVSMS